MFLGNGGRNSQGLRKGKRRLTVLRNPYAIALGALVIQLDGADGGVVKDDL